MELLLIEASVDGAASLVDELRAFGHAVDRVADGQRAVDAAARGAYDVIVLDLTLPRDESLPVLHQIREANREVHILVLSSRDQIHDRVTALIQGADDFVVKPVSAATLHARIQRLRGSDAEALSMTLRARRPRGGRPDFRIGELLRFCEAGELELVISETPLAELLRRLEAGLAATALARGVNLLLPQYRLPTLLVDVRWMEQLLSSLIFKAMIHGKRGSCIELRVSSNCEHCRIDIETDGGFACDLSLARRFARHMQLRVEQIAVDAARFRIAIDGIKIR